MTVAEAARRILDNDWKTITEIDVRTLGLALSMVEAVMEKKVK